MAIWGFTTFKISLYYSVCLYFLEIYAKANIPTEEAKTSTNARFSKENGNKERQECIKATTREGKKATRSLLAQHASKEISHPSSRGHYLDSTIWEVCASVSKHSSDSAQYSWLSSCYRYCLYGRFKESGGT